MINNKLIELNEQELLYTEGGIIPAVVIGLAKGFGIGFGMVAAGVGLYAASKEAF